MHVEFKKCPFRCVDFSGIDPTSKKSKAIGDNRQVTCIRSRVFRPERDSMYLVNKLPTRNLDKC